jgi:hypothetical protein
VAGVAGARELAAQLTAGATAVETLMPAVIEKCAADLVALVQQNASGRPGPNAPTGDYRGSWSPPMPVEAGPASFALSVGTDRPQAARLEYGFVGTDSLGRTFDQPPYPHMGPAVDVIEPVFHAAMDAAAAKALTW